ncbi:carboxypeptidase regulatory-like domain-containing protein [Silvibacterium dinghuense]|uniref:Carboxypeptidase regulatory-like domain-containing protein n=2 Tax=Silvibacterium dinghuense TaxID=1560006 RepID=A0A4Q1SEQ5_9BACT|nr:carboxypeptidase regulatory-like domain-containing protein [Silvibacterium dinghuense]
MTASAATVTGMVTDKTTNKPAAGDDVVLIGFGQGMQEAGRTKTDGTGHYSIDVPDNGMHLIRVDHQKANYFEPVQPGKTVVDVDVYDVEPKVEGVSTEADVMRIEAGPQGMQVVESYFVKNESKPPRTQFGKDAYPITLPAEAKIQSSAAMGPQGMPVASSPMPTGEPGNYAFVFPVRPGETRFQVGYTIPYSGSYKFTPKPALPTANFAVILPKTMKFDGGTIFTAADVEQGAQTYLARGLKQGQTLAFTVSGEGVMPREAQQQDGSDANGQQSASPEADTRPGGGMSAPIDTPDPLQKYKWWILSGLGLLLVMAAAFFLRGKPADAPVLGEPSPLVPTPMPAAGVKPAAGVADPLLASLKEELFALETERLAGRLSEAEYQEQKAALEVVLKRALARASAVV